MDIGIDVHQVDMYGQSALHWAASMGHVELTRALIEEGNGLGASCWILVVVKLLHTCSTEIGYQSVVFCIGTCSCSKGEWGMK